MRRSLPVFALALMLVSFCGAAVKDKFAELAPIHIAIAQAGASSAPAPAASNPEGKTLLARVIAAAGGAEKLNAVKAVRIKANVTLKEQGLSLDGDETDVLPDKVHNSMKTAVGEIVMVVSPKENFISVGPIGVRPLPSSQRDDALKSLRRAVWYVAQHANDSKYVFRAQGTEKIGEVQATVLAIHGDDQDWLWYVDPAGHVVRVQYQADGPTGPSTRIVDDSDFKPVDGITLPFHQEMTVDGKPAASAAVSSYEINPTVDAKIFDKPVEAKP